MKKILFVAITTLILTSCKKENIPSDLTPANSDASAAHKSSAKKEVKFQFPTLIRDWTRWIYANGREISPLNDEDGSRQAAFQPYQNGIFFLAGGGTAANYNREITISLSQYQYIFVPLINLTAWYDECDPDFAPRKNQTAENFFKKIVNDAFNGNKNQLTLLWDGSSRLSTNQISLRSNSGVFSFNIHPSWNGECISPSPSTFYTDGFWDLIKLSLGNHTLVIGGSATIKKFDAAFSNSVTYTIHVVP